MQKYFTMLFGFHEEALVIVVYPALRTQVAVTRFRVPEVLVVRAGVEFERILEVPLLIAIEILSTEDKWSNVLGKVDEYLAFGTENIWIFDPVHRSVSTADAAGLHTFEGNDLSVPETSIPVVLSEAFAKLR